MTGLTNAFSSAPSVPYDDKDEKKRRRLCLVTKVYAPSSGSVEGNQRALYRIFTRLTSWRLEQFCHGLEGKGGWGSVIRLLEAGG